MGGGGPMYITRFATLESKSTIARPFSVNTTRRHFPKVDFDRSTKWRRILFMGDEKQGNCGERGRGRISDATFRYLRHFGDVVGR